MRLALALLAILLIPSAQAAPKRMPRGGCLRVTIEGFGIVCLQAAEIRVRGR